MKPPYAKKCASRKLHPMEVFCSSAEIRRNGCLNLVKPIAVRMEKNTIVISNSDAAPCPPS